MNATHLSLSIPAPSFLPEEAVGQWVSVVAFGQAYVAQIEVAALAGDNALVLTCRLGEPDVEPVEEPEFIKAPAGGTHINCPHSDEPMDIEKAMICSDIGEPGGQA